MSHICTLSAIGLALMLLAADAAPPTTQPQGHSETQRTSFPAITIDRDARTIDLNATVVQNDADWLELIACAPNSREHEAIVTTPAKPSHIHLALITLGLEPGEPLSYTRKGDAFEVRQPHGPAVEVFFVLADPDAGSEREIPVSDWVLNQKTGQPLSSNRFLFTGSRFVQYDGQQVYLADLNGNVVSLVNFADDLLVRPTTMTNQDDDQAWNTRKGAIPPIGTPLKLRLKIAPEHDADDAKSSDET